jgi:polyphosphate kinase
VLFDRSRYNRAGVERVFHFCSPNEDLEVRWEAPEFERMLTRSGIRLLKHWFSVTREEQMRRFQSRESELPKRWKLSPIDRASMDKWDDRTEAKEAMFFYTGTADLVLDGGDVGRQEARAARMHDAFPRDPALPRKGPPRGRPHTDPLIVGQGKHVVGRSEHILGASLHPENCRAT